MSKIIEIYTDGSCSGNPGPGGWAAIVLMNDDKYIISGFEKQTTNNRMEILASINSLKKIKDDYRIKLYTDSNYLKNGITVWIKTWKKNNWINSQKKPVANQDLWVLLDNINEQLHIEWNWVKGHETNLYNNLADKYAVEAMKNQQGVILKNGETTDILKYFGH
tara:strand:+ start:1551 stop:2042 length:492 start_codon:yes stop_codon:yes gene_type:complete